MSCQNTKIKKCMECTHHCECEVEAEMFTTDDFELYRVNQEYEALYGKVYVSICIIHEDYIVKIYTDKDKAIKDVKNFSEYDSITECYIYESCIDGNAGKLIFEWSVYND